MTKRIETIRLLALPLTTNHTRSSVYFYAQRIKPHNNLNKTNDETQTISNHNLIQKLIGFGSKQWNKLGGSAHGTLKSKIYVTGERLMDRIPYEEWALKTIDPAVVPNPLELLKLGNEKVLIEESKVIQLLYPKMIGSQETLMEILSRAMIEREPYHRKWMKLNILLSPLTLPFAIVPLVPNLPFFYMMWRAWSHWRASKASRYLNQMIERKRIIPIESKILNEIYKTNKKSNENDDERFKDDKTDERDKDHHIILNEKMIDQIINHFQLDYQSSQNDFLRAISQVKQKLNDHKNAD